MVSMRLPDDAVLAEPDPPGPATTEVDADAAPGSGLLRSAVAAAVCGVCGRRAHPPRLRLTLAKLGAVLPVELMLHAAVLHLHLSYVAAVLALTLTTTILVIWVVEPSTMRILRTWLHSPHDKRDRRLNASLALWRIRVTVHDAPGALERVTRALARLDANILDVTVHPLDGAVLDELVVSTGLDLGPHDLAEGLAAAGGHDIEVAMTSPLALVDVETRALDLAGRVAANPVELPQAVATLLEAAVVSDRQRLEGRSSHTGPGTETLRIPSPWTAPLLFDRPGRPFSPAESARAHRLAVIAEAAAAG
jgi:predicted amino acid-binding ACT domain protein